MKSKKEKLIILLIMGLIFPLIMSINNNFIENEKQETFTVNPKNSGGSTESFIHVDGSNPKNWSWTAGNYSWCYFKSGYYIIENVTIDASSSPTGSGILISNSKKQYFIVRNCTVYNVAGDSSSYNAGIKLENTNNGTLIENNCSNNNGRGGIFLYRYCYNNTITNNTVIKNSNLGIGLFGWVSDSASGCKNNSIVNNTANYNRMGIVIGDYSENNSLIDNECNFNFHPTFDSYGIRIHTASDKTKLINNTVKNNGVCGIYISYSDDCNITGNTVNSNNKHGIYLDYSNYCNITKNIANDNTAIGVYLRRCDNNVIKNNTMNRNDLGIGLQESDYNNVSGNELKDNHWCIYETYSTGNIIEYNDCSSPTVTGPIFIDGTATGVGAHNWTWAKSQTWCSGSGTDLDPFIIENLKLSAFNIENVDGIDIRNSNVSFIIRNCKIYSANENGINLENVNNSKLINNNCSNLEWGIYTEYSNNITIFENIANDITYDAINVYESNYVNITGNSANDNGNGIYINLCNLCSIIDNTAHGNDEKGIYIEECINITISGNAIYENYDGIFLFNYCYNNTISGNIADGNNQDGIHLEDSNYNSIIENSANDNGRAGIYLRSSDHNNISINSANNCNDGIFLEDECDYNIISENVFNNNDIGIDLYYSNFNTIIENIAYNNSYDGIEVEVGNHNDIIGNILRSNTVFGLYLETDSNNNSIFQNFFLKNWKHAFNEGLDNKWNSTTIGNYWDNHTGPDSNNDGIVDSPYTYIGGSNGGIDNLPIAEDGAPRITINSPSEGDAFSTIAPNFNVIIIEDYLDTMWYTLDGGLSNFTYTENGMINQSAWDVTTDGVITLTFYARDIPGNIGYTNVDIIKDTIAPVILIISPEDGDRFGNNAPLFNVNVTDDNSVLKWYSFDGGLHTYVFTNNTVFNQSAWAALVQGEVTITFYARDLAGNEASESVTVIKSIPSGLDPGVIIIIVVVSVIGGIAVISFVYFYMKRRTAS